MLEQQTNPEKMHVRVENIGGISEMETTFAPGVNVLAGRNATNRTSLLQAITAACGSNQATLKGDAQEGRVELKIGEESYTRILSRQHDFIEYSGKSYLDDPHKVKFAELFAFLLENNNTRRAVALDGDLRKLVMEPVDTDAIEEKIRTLKQEREDIKNRLDELDRLEEKLPNLEQRHQELLTERDELEAEMEAKQDALATAEGSIEEHREAKEEFESTLEALNDTRSSLEDIRYDLQTERERRKQLLSEQEELSTKLDELVELPIGEVDEIDESLDELRSQQQDAERVLDQLQNVIQFNEGMLEGTAAEIQQALQDGSTADDSSEALTDQLVGDETVTCWTCGGVTKRKNIQNTLARLRSLRQEKQELKRSLQEEITELQGRRRELEDQQRQQTQLERKIKETKADLEEATKRITELESRQETLEKELEEVESEVETANFDEENELVDLHKEVNQLEFDMGRTEQKISTVEEEIGTVETRLEDRSDLQSELSDIKTRLDESRNKVEQIERDAIDEFNEQMAVVLDLLEYKNIERIWLERVQRDVRDGRRVVTRSQFELHVIREGKNGVYEDTIETLSESERIVTGLIFALSGYLVHEVHTILPFMLFDSLEAIDADRIHTLVNYFQEKIPYIVIALLPEDASSFSEPEAHVIDV